MTPATTHLPYQGTTAGFRRFSVAEYHRLIEIGLLTEDDNLELLEGYLVRKMSRNPPHDCALQKITRLLYRILPAGWDVRSQSAVTLTESEPEPDFALVRGDGAAYSQRHPYANEIGLVIEVANTSLPGDRDDKGRIYARAGIPVYWIVNVQDRWVEVYSSPSGAVPVPAYAQRDDLLPGQDVPLQLDGAVVCHIPVADLLP